MPQLEFHRPHDEHSLKLIRKEILMWQNQFTDGMILKPEYETEKELEEDWYAFMSQCYEHKCLANSMAYRLYGMKNEEIYNQYKHYFLTHDIIQDKSDEVKVYAPKKASYNEDVDFTDQDRQAQEVMNATGYYIITNTNSSPEQLMDQLRKFRSMDYDKRVKSDNYSLQIYGKKNEERYTEMIPKLLSQDIVQDYDYSPSHSFTYMPKYDETTKTARAYEFTREIVNDPSTPITEAIIITDYTTTTTVPETNIESSMMLTLINTLMDKIDSAIETNWLGAMTPFFLPNEIKDFGIFKNKQPNEWFYRYEARCIGLKPPTPIAGYEWKSKVTTLMDNPLDNKEEILELGWNPSLPINDDSFLNGGMRTNARINYDMGYDFIDISDMINNMSIDKKIPNPSQGIYVIFTKSEDPNIPKVYISFDSSMTKMYPLNNGLFSVRGTNIKDLNCLVSIYMARLPEYKMDKVNEMYNYFIKQGFDYRFKYSFINGICNNIKTAHPLIANEKLFCVYLLNMILSIANMNYRNPHNVMIQPSIANMRKDKVEKDYIYSIYLNKPAKEYISNQIDNMVNYNLDCGINKPSFLYPYLHIIPLLPW